MTTEAPPARGDRVLLDANVLLRVIAPADPRYAVAVAAIKKLEAAGVECVTATQSLCEFWVVATRPKGKPNGFGLTPAAAERQLAFLESRFARLPDIDAVYPLWRRLVLTRGVSGKPTHDARLAATALAAGVPAVLTFNTGDFARFAADGLNPLDPAAV